MKITIYGWSIDVERLVKGPFCLVDGGFRDRAAAARMALETGGAGVRCHNLHPGGGRAVGWAQRAGAWWIGKPPH
jgi:hypothetical protein